MKPKSYTYLIVLGVIVVVILIVLAILPKSSGEKQAMEDCIQSGGTYVVSSQTCAPSGAPAVSTGTGSKPVTVGTSTTRMIFTPASAANDIHIDSPIVNATLHPSTPIKLSGQARGSWFFEATFGAELTDAKGKVISVGKVQSQGDWMVDSMVQFTGSIPYVQQPYGSRGYVVLKKDNPSDMRQFDASVKIPVLFQ